MSVNKAILVGNVGNDPEVRYLEGQGRKVATFRLATSDRYKDRNGVQQERTEWHNIVIWGTNADVVERFVKKGTQLYIEGKIRTREWTDQNGNKRYTTEINVDSLQLLGRRSDEQGSSEGGYQSSPAPAPAPASRPAPQQQASAAAPVQAAPADDVVDLGIGDNSDDLPF